MAGTGEGPRLTSFRGSPDTRHSPTSCSSHSGLPLQLPSPRRGEVLDPHPHGGITAERVEECGQGPKRVAAPVPGEPGGKTVRPTVGSPGRGKGSPSLVPPLQPTLPPQGAWGRPVLYQVVAQHDYSAQRPEDLDFHQGDTVDVLCEGRTRLPFPNTAGFAQDRWELCSLGLGLCCKQTHHPPCLHSGRSLAGGSPRRLHWHFPQVLCGASWCPCESPTSSETQARRPALAINIVTRPVLI